MVAYPFFRDMASVIDNEFVSSRSVNKIGGPFLHPDSEELVRFKLQEILLNGRWRQFVGERGRDHLFAFGVEYPYVSPSIAPPQRSAYEKRSVSCI